MLKLFVMLINIATLILLGRSQRKAEGLASSQSNVASHCLELIMNKFQIFRLNFS